MSKKGQGCHICGGSATAKHLMLIDKNYVAPPYVRSTVRYQTFTQSRKFHCVKRSEKGRAMLRALDFTKTADKIPPSRWLQIHALSKAENVKLVYKKKRKRKAKPRAN